MQRPSGIILREDRDCTNFRVQIVFTTPYACLWCIPSAPMAAAESFIEFLNWPRVLHNCGALTDIQQTPQSKSTMIV